MSNGEVTIYNYGEPDHRKKRPYLLPLAVPAVLLALKIDEAVVKLALDHPAIQELTELTLQAAGIVAFKPINQAQY